MGRGEEKMYENNARVREYDSPKLVYGFFAGAGVVAWVLCLLLASLLTGCGKGSPTTPPPPPNPDDYEALPVSHQLVDSTGKSIGITATLMSTNPPRGSTIGYQQQAEMSIQFRREKKAGPRDAGLIDPVWSNDGRNESGSMRGGVGLGEAAGSIAMTTAGSYNPVGKYVLLNAYQGTLDSKNLRGSTSFFVDYRN